MNSTVRKHGLLDSLKARLGRYYKVIKPHVEVRLGRSLEGKETNTVINAVKNISRNFYRAKIYTLPSVIHRICTESDIQLRKDEVRELLETLPLLLHRIGMSNEKWLIGKIDNHQFDIFMAPERLILNDTHHVNINTGWHIQAKRLYKHPPSPMTLDEWIDFLEKQFEDKIASVDFGFNGHVHFFNTMPLTTPVGLEELRKKLHKLYIPYNKHVDSISLSVEIQNKTGDNTVITLFIYPYVTEGGVLDLDYQRAQKVYPDNNLTLAALQAVKQKIVIGVFPNQ